MDLVAAIGLVLVIEGLVYCGFPSFARRLAEEVRVTPENVLRTSGLLAMVVGISLVWLIRG